MGVWQVGAGSLRELLLLFTNRLYGAMHLIFDKKEVNIGGKVGGGLGN